MFMISTSNHYRYLSLFLSTAGIYSASPTMYAWIANNSAPHYRKAAAIALGPIFANTGGILSTWVSFFQILIIFSVVVLNGCLLGMGLIPSDTN
jgi:hypothetical protein